MSSDKETEIAEAPDVKTSPREQKRGLPFRRMTAGEWIFAGLALAVVCIAACVLTLSLRHYSTMQDGVKTVTLPWEGDGISVTDIASGWSVSDQNSALYRPQVTVATRLDGASGGELIVRFLDQDGRQMGDSVVFSYDKGSFNGVNSSTVTAVCSRGIEGTGFMNEYLYDHVREPWTYYVTYRKNGAPVRYLGKGDIARVLKNQ